MLTYLKMQSEQVLAALVKRHEGDVIVPECKNGETWSNNNLLRLDAWVLKRTYSPLTTIGYEIKVDRHDFEQDQKWPGHLDLCHYFYFACPAGLIHSTELPKTVGLIWVSNSGNAHVKYKAERHDPNAEKLNALLVYVLMSRSRIVANMTEANKPDVADDGLKERLDFLKKVTEKGELAYFVKGHIDTIYQQSKKRNQEANDLFNQTRRFQEHLKKLGIEWDTDAQDWAETGRVDREINKLKATVDPMMLRNMQQTGQRLVELAGEIQELERQAGVKY